MKANPSRPVITLSELQQRTTKAATELASTALGVDGQGRWAEIVLEAGHQIPSASPENLSDDELDRFEALRERLITNLADLMFANFHVVPDDPDQGATVRENFELISPAGAQSGFDMARQTEAVRPMLGSG